MIRVLLADDQPLVRSGLRMILEGEDDLAGVSEAADGAEAVAAVDRHRIDVVLMDVHMPRMDGLEATRQLLARPGDASLRVLMLTTFDDDEYVYEALRAGASGYLLKSVPTQELAPAIRTVPPARRCSRRRSPAASSASSRAVRSRAAMPPRASSS